VNATRPPAFLTALAGNAAVLLAGELVIRTWLESPSVAVPVARFEWAFPPHARLVSSSEGHSVRRTNSMGLLDDELREPRPACRVLLVGDSYAEALEVPKDSCFADVAERSLPGTEIVNAGLSGRSPLDYAEWIETQGAQLNPDVIVVEISDARLTWLLQPAALKRLASPPVPGVNEPAPVESAPRRFMRQCMRRSALVTLAWRRLTLLAADQGAALSRRFNATRGRSAPTVSGVDDPRLPAILDGLHTRIARHAPRVVYLYIPHLEYFAPGVPETNPEVARLLGDLCARRGAGFLDAADAMRAEFLRTGQPVHGFPNSVVGSGHINAAGHRVVGEALARVLAEGTP
jgi:lysophospholipase L1-like esterase